MLQRALCLALLTSALAGCGNTSDEGSGACEGVTCTAGTCEVQDGVAACVCSAFEEAAGVVCEARRDEAGGSIADATPLAPSAVPHPGVLQRLNNHSGADTDVYAFSATAGEVYRFTVSFTSASQDTYGVRLFDAADVTLQQDGCVRPEDVAPQVGFVAPASDTYYLSIGPAWECGHSGSDSEYRILFEALGSEDHADEPVAATPLVPGPLQQGRFELAGDRDWFTFDAEAGEVYRFTCAGHPERDCLLVLHDAQGLELERDSHFQAPSSVSVEAVQTGRYRVKVSRPELYSGAGWGTYDYGLEHLGPDDHGDTPQAATSVPGFGQWMTANVETRQDVDVFALQTEVGRIYRLVPEDPNFFVLQLQDAAGVQLGTSVGDYSFEGGGVRFLSISGPEHTRVGRFVFQLVDLGPDDHGDTPEAASPLPLGETPGRFELSGDRDVFTFPVDPDRYYRVACDGCRLVRPVGSSTLVTFPASVDGATDAYDLDCPVPATAHVTAESAGGTDYTVRLEELGTDDYPEGAARASHIALGTEVRGAIESRLDADAFLVELGAGQSYSLWGAWGYFGIRVASPDGTPLALSGGPQSLVVTPTQSGTHVLSIAGGRRDPAYYPTGSYSFTLQ